MAIGGGSYKPDPDKQRELNRRRNNYALHKESPRVVRKRYGEPDAYNAKHRVDNDRHSGFGW